ncbi:hypothetical protein NPIL_299711 [Nephila pilipes]|uniref:Uncharacterized protein n=1 Tax=Nephila pilipes TaxID=299642 RepID=A0A8X6PHJ2_NEPPI|nr:hypothetical protein NPIL_299711 [Nephila pilipes]
MSSFSPHPPAQKKVDKVSSKPGKEGEQHKATLCRKKIIDFEEKKRKEYLVNVILQDCLYIRSKWRVREIQRWLETPAYQIPNVSTGEKSGGCPRLLWDMLEKHKDKKQKSMCHQELSH